MFGGMGPSVISTYCGAGGMDLGFVRSGFDLTLAVDLANEAVATNNAIHADLGLPQVAQVADVAELTRADGRFGTPTCDVLIGGPPCQGFSTAGLMRDDDVRSQQVWTFLDVAAHLRPSVIVMENVPALAANQRWRSVRDGLLTRCHQLGYLAELYLLDAADFGVPQSRYRAFLIAARDGLEPLEPLGFTTARQPTLRYGARSTATGRRAGERLDVSRQDHASAQAGAPALALRGHVLQRWCPPADGPRPTVTDGACLDGRQPHPHRRSGPPRSR